MATGTRVIRGPDWDLGGSDGGEGHVGTVVNCRTDGTVEVVWDIGNFTVCRCGKNEKHDLKVLDNAPSGVVHTGVLCDGCNSSDIVGIRWKCSECSNYSLCSTCYTTGHHDLAHEFSRIADTKEDGVPVPRRHLSTKSRSLGIYPGATVKRGRDFEGRGGRAGIVMDASGGEIELTSPLIPVMWESGHLGTYRVGHRGKVDLKYMEKAPGAEYYIDHLPVLKSDGNVVPGLRVIRGPDWNTEDDDGSDGDVGSVVNFKDDGTVAVVWDNGNHTIFRTGIDEKYDLRVLGNSQQGVVHPNVTCDGCRHTDISGYCWTCSECAHCNLCSGCYHNNQHNLIHEFCRIDKPGEDRKKVSSRETSKRTRIFGIYPGATVTRGRDYEGRGGKIGIVLETVPLEERPACPMVLVMWESGYEKRYRLGHQGKVDLTYKDAAPGPEYYPEHLPILEIEIISEDETTSGRHVMEERDTAPTVYDETPALKERYTRVDTNELTPIVSEREELVPIDDPCPEIIPEDETSSGRQVMEETDTALSLFVDTYTRRDEEVVTLPLCGKEELVSHDDGFTELIPEDETTSGRHVMKERDTTCAVYDETPDSVEIYTRRDAEAVTLTVSEREALVSRDDAFPAKEGVTYDGFEAVDDISETPKIAPAISQKSQAVDSHTSKTIPDVSQIQNGDKVCICFTEDVMHQIQADGWATGMTAYIGNIGTVDSICNDKDALVSFGDQKYKLPMNVLRKVPSLAEGDIVQLIQDEKQVVSLQNKHGGWKSEHKDLLGKVGKVLKVDTDGDGIISFGRKILYLNPACCIPSPGSVVADVPLAMDGAESTTADTADKAGTVRGVEGVGNHLAQLLAQLAVPEDLVKTRKTPGTDIRVLVVAAANGDLHVVKRIITHNPSLVNQKHKGLVPLHVAAHKGKVDVVRYLLETGAAKDIKTDVGGDTPLAIAVTEGKESVVRCLLEFGVDVNVRNENDRTPMAKAATRGNICLLRLLLSHGGDVNQQDKFGDTPMHDAVMRDHVGVVELLLTAPELNLLIQNKRGFSPLHLAAGADRIVIIQKILGSSPDIINFANDDGYSALHLAVFNDNAGSVKVLLQLGKPDINQRTSIGATSLHLACERGFFDPLKLLIENGANVNATDKDGDTPLHAVMLSEMKKLLLQLVLGTTQGSQTSARIACCLLKYGANLHARNDNGKMPLEVCASNPLKNAVTDFVNKMP